MTYFDLIHHFAIAVLALAALYNSRRVSRIEKQLTERLERLEYLGG